MDVARLNALATPERFRGCVRERAVWIGARYRAQQTGGTVPPAPACTVR